MRIIGGSMRGLRLAEVGAGDPEAHLRPTSDRVRESIFNLLVNGGHGNLVAGAEVLDLFAGTGALGLEALSRGAAHVSFVDDGAAARILLRENIALTKTGKQDPRPAPRRNQSLAPATENPATLSSLTRPMARAWVRAPWSPPLPTTG